MVMLAFSGDSTHALKEAITCLANLSENPKTQEDIDFNGSIEDVPKM